MRSRLALTLVLAIPIILLQECLGPENEPAGIYIVETIQGITVEEFSKRFSAYEWPLAIDLTNGLSDSTFTGEVKLAKVGWTPIDRNCTEPNCFILDVKGKLGTEGFIVFHDISIEGNDMKGSFAIAGPTIDTAGFSFTAIKK